MASLPTTMAGELFMAPVGTPPGDRGWVRVGHTTSGLRWVVAEAIRQEEQAVRLALTSVGHTVTLTLPTDWRQLRSLRRLLGFPRSTGPRPLARGCLPASKMRGRRR